MKKFLIVVAAIAAIGFMSPPVMADERPRRERDDDHRDLHHHHRHGRGFAFSYYRPTQVLGGIGNYAVGVSARIGRGTFEVVSAPFTTAPIMGPPRSYMYSPSRVEYTAPAIRRIYPRRRHWHWHRH
tara:strand:- start:9 stop:389 length:381 start_codon:yes stop_codon:yes gene_type:complete